MPAHRDRPIDDLRGRVAVVTGAGSGIGLGIAGTLAQAGARVVAFEKDAAHRETFLGAVGSEDPDDFVAVDVSDDAAVDALTARLTASTGRIDVLVNNAGIREIGDAMEIEQADWQRVLDVDLTGTFNCSRAAGRVMADQGSGSIVNIASIAGLFGFRRRTAYTVAKHGVIGLTRVLAAELGPAGVRVNAICPGMIDTPLTRTYVTDPHVVAGFRTLVPLGRAGTTQEIGDAALFLAGDGSAFITGVALPVDGGFTASATYDPSGDSQTFAKGFSVTDGPQ